MLLQSCMRCEFHDMREEEGATRSHCRKENCWSQFSKCVTAKALHRFLDQDSVGAARGFSAISHAYPSE
ncbi:MAG: hypothetical protein ACUVXD_15800 [Thermodesulfobacteriota bacterium]